ncbi:MAG: sensor histidine kinase [Culicoidibacterales bacterium]
MFSGETRQLIPYKGLLVYSTLITIIYFVINMISDQPRYGYQGSIMFRISYTKTMFQIIEIMFLDVLIYLISLFAFTMWLKSRNMQGSLDLSKESSLVSDSIKQIRQELEISKDDYIRLSSFIAHEQKNILSLLRAKIQLKQDSELLEDVDKMALALDDILTMTATEQMYQSAIVDMVLVCAAAVDNYSKITNNLEFTYDTNVTSLVLGRELWLMRAVSNLIENAIKYGQETKVTVDVSTKKGSVIIKITDGGKGLDQKVKEQIYSDTYKVAGINNDGYGIGHNLVKHVCALTKGVFLAESLGGLGTTLYMILPEYRLKEEGKTDE